MTLEQLKKCKVGDIFYSTEPTIIDGNVKYVVAQHTIKDIPQEKPYDGKWFQMEDGVCYPCEWAWLTEEEAKKELREMTRTPNCQFCGHLTYNEKEKYYECPFPEYEPCEECKHFVKGDKDNFDRGNKEKK